MDIKLDADVSEDIGEFANSKMVTKKFVGGKEDYMDGDIELEEDTQD
jgi:hypothetical protein